MNPVAEDILMHYGVKRRSGRYPWGSGENPYQHSGDFVSRVQELKKQGLNEKEIAKAMKFDSTTDYRLWYSIAKNRRRELLVEGAKSLKEDGLGDTEIGVKLAERYGMAKPIPESTIRSYLNKTSEENMNRAQKTANILEKELEKKGVIDIGSGASNELGVSANILNQSAAIMEAKGYVVQGISLPQPSDPSKRTTVKVLCKPDITQRDLYNDPSLIQPIGEYHSRDGGTKWDKREYPASIKSNRVKIRYAEDGGIDKDGVIEIRRGVPDLDLGNSHYAQVRILVDGTHYLKGMAMYSDDIPDGSDIVFNTNKKKGTPKLGDKGVLKKIKDDPDNPFGAYIKADGQSYYKDKNGKEKLSAINKLKEEGDWDTMSRNLSSQFLSKQPMDLINKQLKLTYADYISEFDEIKSYNNPAVKQKLLLDFANKCDSAVVHLKAAALPRQETRVILPVTQLKDTEVYAPYLRNGERVCLVRYPHGGTFEIPELVVNNKNPSAKKILGNAIDAIGINSKVAERLSGADFDGDQVIVIPVNSRVKVKTSPQFEDLKTFDPKTEYAYREGMTVMQKSNVQREMGAISNLITDMTLAGAPPSEMVRAVKHSMVVIDAEKHKLDYKRSFSENHISELQRKYQPKYDADGNVIGSGGAHTLISKKGQFVYIPERKGAPHIDKETGEVIFKESGRTYIDKKGNVVEAKTRVPKMSVTKDIRTLSSGTAQEEAYAKYANSMKALANTVRKEYLSTKNIERSASAAKTYAKEVESLNSKLNIAQKNQPRERRALAIANSTIKAKIQEYPELLEKGNKKDLEKVKRLAMDDARFSVGASSKDTQITITDREWEAIQASALSHTKVKQILRYADSDAIRQRALPKTTTTLSDAKVNKMKQMKNSGYTIQQIASSLGVSTSTVSKYLNNV